MGEGEGTTLNVMTVNVCLSLHRQYEDQTYVMSSINEDVEMKDVEDEEDEEDAVAEELGECGSYHECILMLIALYR